MLSPYFRFNSSIWFDFSSLIMHKSVKIKIFMPNTWGHEWYLLFFFHIANSWLNSSQATSSLSHQSVAFFFQITMESKRNKTPLFLKCPILFEVRRLRTEVVPEPHHYIDQINRKRTVHNCNFTLSLYFFNGKIIN